MERKKELRKQIAQKKTQYSASTLETLSADIMDKVGNHPVFQMAETVLLYHSMRDEVETHAFIEKWSSRKKIILPVVRGDVLELRIYTDPHNLSTNAYGIAEPTGALFDDYASIDFAVIPGVAFDRQGHRLGRGKGFYDKLLPHIPARKVGVCFPFQLIESVPSDDLDVSMDEIITL